jgi:hypothetical protein
MTNGPISLAAIDAEDPRPLRMHEAAKLARIGINQACRCGARGYSVVQGRRILIPHKPFLAMINGGDAESPAVAKTTA